MDDFRATPYGFRASYLSSAGTRVNVHVHLGTQGRPDEDKQRVYLTDRGLPFTIDADVWEGRLDRVEFMVQAGHGGRQLEQRDLRTSGVVSLVHRWARVGREYQVRRKRGGALDEGLIFEVEAADIEAAIAATRSTLERLAPSRADTTKRRLRGAEAEALLQRVVARYKELTQAGHTAPRVVIADEEALSSAYIGRLLVKARKAGLLSAALPGRAGQASEYDPNDPDEF